MATPKTPPSSDLDGVDEDEVRNTDAARAAGQDASDLERARRESKAKPTGAHADEAGRDDRSG